MKALKTVFLCAFYLVRPPKMEFYLLKQFSNREGLRRPKALSCSVLYSLPKRGALCDRADVISLTCRSRRSFSADPVISRISLRSREHFPRKVHVIANEKSHYSKTVNIQLQNCCFLGFQIQRRFHMFGANVFEFGNLDDLNRDA